LNIVFKHPVALTGCVEVHTRDNNNTIHKWSERHTTRNKTITTTGLSTENNMRTPKPLEHKKSEQRDIELYCLDKWTTPPNRGVKRIFTIVIDFKILKSKLI
jgi:hypothetical protein